MYNTLETKNSDMTSSKIFNGKLKKQNTNTSLEAAKLVESGLLSREKEDFSSAKTYIQEGVDKLKNAILSNENPSKNKTIFEYVYNK
jgi:hypothetical protein